MVKAGSSAKPHLRGGPRFVEPAEQRERGGETKCASG